MSLGMVYTRLVDAPIAIIYHSTRSSMYCMLCCGTSNARHAAAATRTEVWGDWLAVVVPPALVSGRRGHNPSIAIRLR